VTNKNQEAVNDRIPGVSSRIKNSARLLVVLGAVLVGIGLFADQAGAAQVRQQPHLTSVRATFAIKAGNPATVTWELSLWEITTKGQKRAGEDSGTTGTLVVKVPATSSCDFQVDVTKSGTFYSGYKKVVAFCGGVSVSGTTSTTVAPTTTTTKTTPTTSKPKTSGGGGTTPTTASPGTKSGSGGSPGSTSVNVAPSALAFTGAGIMMWLVALIGLLLLAAGSGLLLYARRYPTA